MGYKPLPKPPEQRRRRNKEVRIEVEVPEGGVPARLFPGDEAGEDPRLVAWWYDWAELEETAAWKATDWRRLEDVLPLYRLYLQAAAEGNVNGAVKLFAEIRQNCSLLGATVSDRLRNKVDVKRAAPAAAGAQPQGRRRLRVVDENAAGA